MPLRSKACEMIGEWKHLEYPPHSAMCFKEATAGGMKKVSDLSQEENTCPGGVLSLAQFLKVPFPRAILFIYYLFHFLQYMIQP